MAKRERYFIKVGEGPEREVDLDEFCEYERIAGFTGFGEGPATAGFYGKLIQGTIRYMDDDDDEAVPTYIEVTICVDDLDMANKIVTAAAALGYVAGHNGMR